MLVSVEASALMAADVWFTATPLMLGTDPVGTDRVLSTVTRAGWSIP